MMGWAGTLRAFCAGALLCGGVAGCSDGVEVNSKLFNTIGSSITAGSHKEPQLADRPGLVVPPKMAALPQPGSGDVVAADVNAQFPNGPEQTAAAAAAAKKAKDDEACRKAAENRKDPDLRAACPGLLAKLSGITLGDSAQ